MTFKFVVEMWKLLLASLPTLHPCHVRTPKCSNKVSNENNKSMKYVDLTKPLPL